MSRFKKDDRSLIEVGNDNGDHWVIELPTSEVRKTEKALRDAGCEHDHDESSFFSTSEKEKNYKQRDHEQYRYHSARIVDEEEDLEDNHDRELDASDYEPDEQPAWRWW